MKPIPYTKAIAVGNDFLIVEMEALSINGFEPTTIPEFARSICDRKNGVGADGLEVVSRSGGADAEIHLWNSDGSVAELSGNGTRCVAAYLLSRSEGLDRVTIDTAAGLMKLDLIHAKNDEYMFKMTIKTAGVLESEPVALNIDGSSYLANVINVGNPQCSIVVEDFDFDWLALGDAIERYPLFPEGTNVSFVKVLNRHTIVAKFWERGAGATKSSGTGSVGAAIIGMLTSLLDNPVTVQTDAGDMLVEWADDLFLQGSARLIEKGTFAL